MHLNFENDFTASVAAMLYVPTAFIVAAGVFVYFLLDTGSILAAALGFLTIGILAAIMIGFAVAVAGTALAWLVRLWLRERRKFLTELAETKAAKASNTSL